MFSGQTWDATEIGLIDPCTDYPSLAMVNASVVLRRMSIDRTNDLFAMPIAVQTVLPSLLTRRAR